MLRSPATTPLRVLIVDDNEVAAEMLAAALSAAGPTTAVAADGPISAYMPPHLQQKLMLRARTMSFTRESLAAEGAWRRTSAARQHIPVVALAITGALPLLGRNYSPGVYNIRSHAPRTRMPPGLPRTDPLRRRPPGDCPGSRHADCSRRRRQQHLAARTDDPPEFSQIMRSLCRRHLGEAGCRQRVIEESLWIGERQRLGRTHLRVRAWDA